MTQELEIVRSRTGDCKLEQQLVAEMRTISSEGTLYFGYPVFPFEGRHLRIDALFSSRKFGLTVFDLSHYSHPMQEVEQDVIAHQEFIYSALVTRMLARPEMRSGRGLALQLKILSLHQESSKEFDDGTLFCTFGDLHQQLKPDEILSEELYRHLNAFIQKTSSLHPSINRNHVGSKGSIGSILQKIEKKVFNLDYAQKKAAIELCDGPQRIRGIAGTGKTMVLALKAALLHMSNPDWRILVTFHSWSLYQQFKNLVRRFTFEYKNEDPNWEKLTIMQAWGNLSSKGVYFEICTLLEKRPMNFSEAKSKYGVSDALGIVCEQLISDNDTKSLPCIYDVVLIDEAQDLPQSFFDMVNYSTRSPKRVIYAFDEIQSLNNKNIKSPEILFKPNTTNLMDIRSTASVAPTQDITLNVCYRSPPWIISLAHALDFGIYNEGGIVNFFDQPSPWNDLGYCSKDGQVESGKMVSLKRKKSSVPLYFENSIEIDKSVLFKTFHSKKQERNWIRDQILSNLQNDEVEPEDIVIVITNTLNFKDEYYELTKVLGAYDFGLHAPMVISSLENFFEKNSIAISDIYRARAIEAPIVYLYGAEYCLTNNFSNKKRNILYTALTRSLGWVRVTGVGRYMEKLENEFKIMKKNNFNLNFQYPSESALEKIRTQFDEEKNSRKQNEKFLLKLFNNEVTADELPVELKEELLVVAS